MDNSRHYQLVARAIRWLSDHRSNQPNLEELAAAMCVSPHHLQRTFQAWAGVSPKQFLKSLTREAAMERLMAGCNVLEASAEVGLSGPGRLHDLLITTESLTPGQVRTRAEGVTLQYGFGRTPFGEALVCWSERGLNFLGFCDELGKDEALAQLRRTWTKAAFSRNEEEARRWLLEVFAESREQPLPVWLRGSRFQLKIWEALLAVPGASHVTYGALARYAGKPTAARAVGSAVGANPLAWIIPCHRVIRQMGEFGRYRWGAVTKQAMIGMEAARRPLSGNGVPGRQVDKGSGRIPLTG